MSTFNEIERKLSGKKISKVSINDLKRLVQLYAHLHKSKGKLKNIISFTGVPTKREQYDKYIAGELAVPKEIINRYIMKQGYNVDWNKENPEQEEYIKSETDIKEIKTIKAILNFYKQNKLI